MCVLCHVWLCVLCLLRYVSCVTVCHEWLCHIWLCVMCDCVSRMIVCHVWKRRGRLSEGLFLFVGAVVHTLTWLGWAFSGFCQCFFQTFPDFLDFFWSFSWLILFFFKTFFWTFSILFPDFFWTFSRLFLLVGALSLHWLGWFFSGFLYFF